MRWPTSQPAISIAIDIKNNELSKIINVDSAFVAVAGLEPATNGVNDISSLYALPLSYTTHRIYIPSYKQLAATPAYGNNRRAHPHYWTCNQDSVFISFCMLP